MEPMMPITIQKITPDDWRVWKAIRLESLKLHPKSFGSTLEIETAWTEKKFRDTIESNTIFGAYLNNDNSLIGTVGFFTTDNPKMSHKSRMGGMYVSPESRGSGASHGLIEAVIEQARQCSLQLHCSVVIDNIPALKLYKRHGFIIYGTEPRAIKIDDRYYDEYHMLLDLS